MINTDLSRRQEWRAVKGFDNQFTLTFLESGVAFDTSSYMFAVNIRKIGDSTNVVELVEGDGITNGGATGIVTILLDETASDIIAKGYFFEIIYVNGSFTNRLLQGTFNLVDDYNTDNTSTSLTLNVDLNGTDVRLNVTLGSSDFNTRSISTASTATLTPNLSLYDMAVITAQSTALLIANPTGTPVNGNAFMIDVTDNGTARAITYGDDYVGYAVALPSTTILGKGMKMVFQYDSVDGVHNLLTVINEI